MARHLFAILDDLTSALAELKAALAPLLALGGAVLTEATKPATVPRGAKKAPSRPKRRLSPNQKAALKQQGLYLAALNRLKPAQRVQVKKARGAKGLPAAMALARKMAG
jgi:hypothetical protein